MFINATALLLASEVNFLASYWKFKVIPISHTAANNKLLMLSWVEGLCGLPKQDNYLATLSRGHQVAFCDIHLLLSAQSLITWCPGEEVENSFLSSVSTTLYYVVLSHYMHSSSQHEHGSPLWPQTVLEMLVILGVLLALAEGGISLAALSILSTEIHIWSHWLDSLLTPEKIRHF